MEECLHCAVDILLHCLPKICEEECWNAIRMFFTGLTPSMGTQLSQVIRLKTEECNVCNYFERHDIEFTPTRKKCNY
ncbi:hypothetical protein ACB092_02G134000 [Castanea dentata]